MTILDVGHGLSAVVSLPDRSTFVFDAGSMSRSDVGGRIVAPFLRFSGTAGIGSVIISHNDTDHVNGIPELTSDFRVGNVFASGLPDEGIDTGYLAAFLARCLAGQGLYIEPIEGFEERNCGNVRVLWPTREIRGRHDLSDNDRSVVLLLRHGGRKILLCADIEKYAQNELLRTAPGLEADVVVAPHHGSARTLDGHFLPAIRPRAVVSSCGRKQYESGQVVSDVEGARMFYTARDGAVTVTIDEDGSISCETYRSNGD
jgi:competence protein ComEC